MAKLEDVSFVKEVLKTLVKAIRSTYETLSQVIQRPDTPPKPQQAHYLSTSLEHIGHMREGFILSQRVSTHSEADELRYLAQQVLFDWQWLEELGLALKSGDQIERLGSQLITYQHSLTVLGLLPHLPPEVITFPQPHPSYADVPVPRLPGQMLDRIEEIEHILYRASFAPLDMLAFDAVRRTYAFFEASVWVINQHLTFMLRE